MPYRLYFQIYPNILQSKLPKVGIRERDKRHHQQVGQTQRTKKSSQQQAVMNLLVMNLLNQVLTFESWTVLMTCNCMTSYFLLNTGLCTDSKMTVVPLVSVNPILKGAKLTL